MVRLQSWHSLVFFQILLGSVELILCGTPPFQITCSFYCGMAGAENQLILMVGRSGEDADPKLCFRPFYWTFYGPYKYNNFVVN